MKKDTRDTLLILGAAGIAGTYVLYKVAQPAYESFKSSLRAIPIIGQALGGAGSQPSSGDKFLVQVLDPIPGLTWGVAIRHDAKVRITNPSASTAFQVYCGMSIQTPSGAVKDFPLQVMTFNASETKEISWPVSGAYQIGTIPLNFNFGLPVLTLPDINYPLGAYQIRFSVWRTLPIQGITPETDRIGDSNWINFNYGVI